MKKLFVLSFLFPLFTFANHPHRHGKSHVHGNGKMSLAFDGPQGKLEFEAPNDGILGFEHKAKSEDDKKKVLEVEQIFTTKLAELVVFDSTLKCQFQNIKFESQADNRSGHSETEVLADINCAKSPKGTTIQFVFSTFFPALKKISVQVLVDDIQKSLTIEKDKNSIELK